MLLYTPNYNESIAISGKHGLKLPQAANYVNIDCDWLETTLTLSSHELNSKLRSYRRWITMILIVIDIKKAKQLQPTILDCQLLVTSMTNDNTRYYSKIYFIFNSFSEIYVVLKLWNPFCELLTEWFIKDWLIKFTVKTRLWRHNLSTPQTCLECSLPAWPQ